MGQHSKTLRGAAVTSTSRASTGTIAIPAKKGGTLIAVEAISYGTLESGMLGAGGLIELENDARNWKPFQFYTDMPHELTATSGGFMFQKSTRIKCNKKLPSNSTVTVWFTPFDDQSQSLQITLFWLTGGFSGKETFFKTGKGSAVTATTKTSGHVSITVPAEKGGQLVEARALGIATSPIVVGTDPNYMGGAVFLRNESASEAWEPLEFHTGAPSGLVAGAYFAEHTVIPLDIDLPGNSTVYADYQPANDASQYLLLTIKWEK